jgi:hypothetical protein
MTVTRFLLGKPSPGSTSERPQAPMERTRSLMRRPWRWRHDQTPRKGLRIWTHPAAIPVRSEESKGNGWKPILS